MTTEEKKKELIELEWSFFQAVQNEGRRADCQNDPETFYIMRKSQFDSWNAALIDSYLTDLRNRNAAGENPIAEKICAHAGRHCTGAFFYSLFPFTNAFF